MGNAEDISIANQLLKVSFRPVQRIASPDLGPFEVLKSVARSELVARFQLQGSYVFIEELHQVISKRTQRSNLFAKTLFSQLRKTGEYCGEFTCQLQVFVEYHETSLASVFRSSRRLSEGRAMELYRVLVQAVGQAQESGLFIRLLTPQTICIDKGGQFRVFEEVRLRRSEPEEPSLYEQPFLVAMIRKSKKREAISYDPVAANVWMVGLVMLEAFSGQSPRALYRHGVVTESVLKDCVGKCEQWQQPLVGRLLRLAPETRPSVFSLLQQLKSLKQQGGAGLQIRQTAKQFF